MIYVSSICYFCLAEDKDTLFFCTIHNTGDFSKKKSLNAPHETWIQSSDLLLSCPLILREGEERQLGLVYTWSLCVICRIGNKSDLLLLAT